MHSYRLRGHRLILAGVSVAAVTLGPVLGVGVAGATTSGTLTLTPNELYYPCNGIQGVDAQVTGFTPSSTVDLRVDSARGKIVATIATDSTGSGSTVKDVNTAELRPGQWTIYAVQTPNPTIEATAVFTEG